MEEKEHDGSIFSWFLREVKWKLWLVFTAAHANVYPCTVCMNNILRGAVEFEYSKTKFKEEQQLNYQLYM